MKELLESREHASKLLKSISIALAFFTFMMLAFPVYGVEANTLVASENGLQFLNGSPLLWREAPALVVLMVILSYFMLLSSIGIFAWFIITATIPAMRSVASKKIFRILDILLPLLCLFLSFVYLLESIIASAILASAYSSNTAYTQIMIPAILLSVVAFAFFYVLKKRSDIGKPKKAPAVEALPTPLVNDEARPAEEAAPAPAAEKPTAVNIDHAYEELKKLKELLDGDILTREEFDAKKKELLQL